MTSGWYGNTISFKQNKKTVATVGSNFTSGKSFGPFIITFKPNLKVDIVVGALGSYTEVVGFIIRTAYGYIVFQRTASTYYSNSILGSFTPSALNFIPDAIAPVPSNIATTSNENNLS